MSGLVEDTARAVAFLSRIPVPDRFFADDSSSISQSARAYAFAGAVICLPASLLLFVLLSAGLDPLFSSALTVAFSVLVCGALHEDGLADCADGFGGGSSRERVLDIMKDSAIGAYGGLALIVSFVTRVAGVAVLASQASPVAAALALLSVGISSRAAMVWHWHGLPAARTDGVAALAGQPDEDAMRLALTSGLLLSFLLALPAVGAAGALTAPLIMAAAAFGFRQYVSSRIGGHTGDTIGATQQICEIAALLGLALWL